MIGNLKFIFIIQLILLGSLVGCLPQEKTTQCGQNENFNPATKSCISSLSLQTNLIAITTVVPATSYTRTTASTAEVHTITVSDPNNYGYITKWYLHKSSGLSQNVANNTNTYTVNPSTLPIGSHVVEVIIYDNTGTAQIDAKSWVVTISNDPVAELTNTSTPITIAVDYDSTTSINLTATVLNPDELATLEVDWVVDGVTTTTTAISTATSEVVSLAVDPTTLAIGTHSVEITLYDDSTTPTTYYDYNAWSINRKAPDLTTVTAVAPDPATTISVIDQITMGAGGFDNGAAVNDFCVTVADPDGSDAASGLNVIYYLGGTSLATVSSLGTATAGVTCLNADGGVDPSVTLVNPQVGENKTMSARVFDVFTGLEITTAANPIVWTLSVRPQNNPPSIYVEADGGDANHQITCAEMGAAETSLTCQITQDTTTKISIRVTDDDYPDYLVAHVNNFASQFYLDGSLMTAAPDCDYAYADGATKYECDLYIPSYDTNGPIEAATASYTITAQVTDQTLYPVAGNPGLQSNIVTWSIPVTNVTNFNTSLDIQPQTNDVGTDTNDSYVYETSDIAKNELDNTSVTVAEGDSVTFNVSTMDLERDHYHLKFEYCADTTITCAATTIIGTMIITRTDDTLYDRQEFTYVLPDNVVTAVTDANTAGTGEDLVYFKVTAIEYLEDGTTATGETDELVFSFNVQDTNYPQVFPTDADTDFTPDPTVELYTMTGFPISLDPGTITDDNVLDGATIAYQWEVSTDAGSTFENIPGATDRTLVWSPDPSVSYNGNGTLQQVLIRLCTGDDGIGNDLGTAEEVCSDDVDIEGIWTVNIIPNMVTTAGYDVPNASQKAGGEEVAIWHDTNSAIPTTYVAYGTNDGYVVVEKIIHDDQDDDVVGSVYDTLDNGYVVDSVVFETYYGDSTNNAFNLSIVGETSTATDAHLYVSYVAQDIGDGKNKLHVRRLDISEQKTGLSHPGAFGFNYPGLDSVITLTGAGMTKSVDANQRSVITITTSTFGERVTFTFGASPALDFFNGTQFCNPSCGTTANAATQLAAAINSSTDLRVQGVWASASGNDVTLYGTVGGSYDILNTQVQDAGDIMIIDNGGGTLFWAVPYLDNEAVSANKNRIHFYYGAVGEMNGPNNPAHLKYLTAATTENVAASEIESWNDNDLALIAIKAESGYINIMQFTFNGVAFTQTDAAENIFNGQLVGDIRMAAGVTGSNNMNYITAKETATGDIFLVTIEKTGLGVYDYTPGVNGRSSPPVQLLDSDDNESGPSSFNFDLDDLNDYAISPALSTDEFYLAVATSGTNTDPDEIFVLKAKKDTSANWELYCGPDQFTCPSIHYADTFPTISDSLNNPLAITPVLQDFTKGDEGATSGENVKNVVFLGYFVDYANDGNARAQMATVNVEEEQTDATSSDVNSASSPAIIAPE
jgi:hypothetical protein